MKRNKREEKIHLTDHFTYQIIDNIIYLFEEDKDISLEELNVLFKKVSLLIDDDDIAYINISGKNMEKKKNFYQEMGFSLSYYSVDKLNALYKGYEDKRDYRCYAVMTKNDFLNINKKGEDTVVNKEIKKENNSNKGFINSMLLLFGGIVLLCYFTIEGAILLMKLGR